MAQGRMYDPREILAFMTAGKATITLQNAASGNRYTYKIKFAAKRNENDPDTWFVQLLNGPDNTASFCYFGILRHVNNKLTYIWTSKARISEESPSVKAFKFALNLFVNDCEFPPSFEVYHEGRCGRCGRKLTVPESITSGFGPECINLVSFGAVSSMQAPIAAAVAVGGTAVPQQQKFNYTAPAKSEPVAAVRGRVADAVAHLASMPPRKSNRAAVAANGRSSSPTPVGAATADGGSFLDNPVVARVDNMDAEIRRRIAEYKAEAPENYYQDGMLQEKEAFNVAYNMFRVQLQGGK
jgi:hypothetical protein